MKTPERPPKPASCEHCDSPLSSPVWNGDRGKWQRFCSRECYRAHGKIRRISDDVRQRRESSIDRLGKRWTSEERTTFTEMYQDESVSLSDLIIRFRRTQDSIRGMAKSMGLHRHQNTWSKEEDRMISALYHDASKEEIMRNVPGRSWSSITSRAQRMGIKRRDVKQYSVVSDYFSSIDNDAKAYWLGIMASDGYVCGKNKVALCLSEKDANLVDDFVSEVCPDCQIRSLPRTSSVRAQFSDSRMRQDLEKYGIVPRKSYSLVWPSALSEQYSMPFILGLFDGDGCLTRSSGRWRWSLSGTESILEEAKSRLENLFDMDMGSIYHYPSGKTRMCTIQTSGEKVIMIDAHMMQYNIGLRRKRIAWHPHTLATLEVHQMLQEEGLAE